MPCRASCWRTSAGSRPGKGQYLDLALLDSAVSVLGLPAGIVAATGESPGRLGNAHPSLAPYEPYPAADGAVIVAVANPRLWTRFCAAVGDADARARSALCHQQRTPGASRGAQRTDRAIFKDQTVDELLDALGKAGVPCGRVRTMDEVLQDPQLAARQMLIALATGARTVTVPGNPIQLSDLPPLPASPPPALGEHTDEIRASVARDTRRSS